MKQDFQNNRIRVLFILPALTSGGAERVLITLMNNLDREKFDPHFLTISDRGSLRQLIDPQIPSHTFKMRHVSWALFRLFNHIRKTKPDIIVSTMAHMNMVLLLLRPFFPRTKFIVREAITPSYILEQHPVIQPFIRLAYKQLYKMADLVLSPSQVIIDSFKNDLHMKCANHRLLYNPVDLSLIRSEAHDKGAACEESAANENNRHRLQRVQFVAAGRLNPQKGFDRLIEALASFKMPYEWHLTIWGKGTERGRLRDLILRHNLKDKVRLGGHLQAPWPQYAHADCFVMPSRWEGLPNVALESLACGTPVIATRESGGIGEIQTHAGKEHVRIVDNMEQFLAEMALVTPQPATHFRPSLLPDCFSKKAALKQFQDILIEVRDGPDLAETVT